VIDVPACRRVRYRTESELRMTTPTPATPDQVTMYSTPWCGYCRRLKSQMEREGIAYVEVDIEADPAAADYVMSVNGGNQTVPTVVFPDGSALTNPTLVQVKARLEVA
jgi:mycoredoxin